MRQKNCANWRRELPLLKTNTHFDLFSTDKHMYYHISTAAHTEHAVNHVHTAMLYIILIVLNYFDKAELKVFLTCSIGGLLIFKTGCLKKKLACVYGRKSKVMLFS